MATPEDEDVVGHQDVFQLRLHLYHSVVEAVAHVSDAGNQPDFGP